MAKIFYLSEIVKFAIEKEQESFDFYKALAEKEENAEIKSVFETLKLEEQQHEAFYKGMLNTVTEEQTPRVHEDEEYAVYMQTLIDASRQQSPRTAAEFSDTKVAIDYGTRSVRKCLHRWHPPECSCHTTGSERFSESN